MRENGFMASAARRGGKQVPAGPKVVRPRRDFQAMEERRLRAADLFVEGVSQAEIARRLEVTGDLPVGRTVFMTLDGTAVPTRWAGRFRG
jgi:hypothetical protein